MKEAKVRAKAIALIRNKNKIFVGFSNSKTKKEDFYTLLGGGIEPGEKGAETVIREFQEEAGLGIEKPHFLGLLENIFEWEGRPDHEIVLVYEATFKDKSIYGKKMIVRYDDQNKEKVALWKPIEFFKNPKNKLYPNGLLELIK